LKTPTRLVLTSGILAILGVVAAACSSTQAAPVDYTGSCKIITAACHPHDTGDPSVAHDCHELGHSKNDLKCGPKQDECLKACPPVDGGTSDDAGDAASPIADSGSDSDAPFDATPPDPCIEYCACMASTCSTISGYPYSAPGSCESACAQLGTAEKACFPNHCKNAKTTNTAHNCEHAWGVYGLDEC
jgi:hypothetical protein